MTQFHTITDGYKATWQQRLDHIVETMREMSGQTDPQDMVRAYAKRMRKFMRIDASVSLSRRDLDPPAYRITRSTLWKEPVNPWKSTPALPVFTSGLLGELLYADEPRIIDDLRLNPDDPAADYFEGQRSLMAIPLFDLEIAMNMVVFMRKQPAAFDREQLPEFVWQSNLFGRATHNLVLTDQVKTAYDVLDQELKSVADIQRSLLPAALPDIPTLSLAAQYQTARRAGGDYYDFFPLPDGTWGVLIADVSGHGTPAAVLMAITHAIAHSLPDPPTRPAEMLEHLNRRLANRYTADSPAFVTAFYAVYDPATGALTYASAGHNPPRLKHCVHGDIESLDGAQKLPLAVDADETYRDHTQQLRPGDQLIFYTDGITEAFNPAGEMFGLDRLDDVLSRCQPDADHIIDRVLTALSTFTDGQPADDDRTLLIAKVS